MPHAPALMVIQPIAIQVASSGVSALLLDLGRTFHSRFKASISIGKGDVFNIPKQSGLANLLRDTKLIIWDEALMMSRYLLEGLNLTLQDLCDSELPFAGKVVVLAGDHRQVLPIQKYGSKGQILDLTHKRSDLWRHFELYSFSQNIRVLSSRDAELSAEHAELVAFTDWLLAIGDGTIPELDDQHTIEIDADLCMPFDEDLLINFVFPRLNENLRECTNEAVEWISERAILAPKNVHVRALNDRILDLLEQDELRLYSADRTKDPDDSVKVCTCLSCVHSSMFIYCIGHITCNVDMCIDMCVDVCVDAGVEVHTDICIDMCINMCIDMCIDMCVRTCIDMCINMCIDMCRHMRMKMCIGMHINMCIDMCITMCIDVCTGMCINMFMGMCTVYKHVCRHVYRHVYRHVHEHVYRPQVKKNRYQLNT
jgi:hypothetical protein